MALCERGETPAKIWAFKKKNYGLSFFRFYNCGPFRRRATGANVSNAFLFNKTLLGSSIFFVIKHFMLNLTKCLLPAETFALIH